MRVQNKIKIIENASIVLWLGMLINTKAHYFIYVVIGGATLSIADKGKNNGNSRGFALLAGMLSLCVSLANYEIWMEHNRWMTRGAHFSILFLTGWVMFRALLGHLYLIWVKNSVFEPSLAGRSDMGRWRYFWVPFGIMAAGWAALFFLGAYPGYLTSDSLSQVRMALTRIDSNHHPFYHTLLIKLCLGFSDDINTAVGFYSILQIAAMAAVISFGIYTLYQSGLCRKAVIVITMFYLLVPYYWMYSWTMWKDVWFGMFGLLLLIGLFRYENHIGHPFANMVMLLLSGVGICLFRSNGTIAYVIFCTVWGFAIWKKLGTDTGRRLAFIRQIATLLSALIISLILKGPVLECIDVKQPDIMESLSIPIQQIARVVVDGGEVSDVDMELIEAVADIDEIKESYQAHISDPVKALLRKGNADEVIGNNKGKYFGLWIRIGIRNPAEYMKAWVDQTKGYWNAGYGYWIFATGIDDNDFGIAPAPLSSSVFKMFNQIKSYVEYDSLFSSIAATGLCTWIYLSLAFFGIFHGGRTETLLCLFPLAVIATLLVATPVFNEFRYAFILYMAAPFCSTASMHK